MQNKNKICPEAIIFDLDGTLAETHELIFASFNHVTEKYLNKRMSNEEIVSYFGPTEDVILKEWMRDNYENARNDYYNFYEANHDDIATNFPGMKEILFWEFLQAKERHQQLYP